MLYLGLCHRDDDLFVVGGVGRVTASRRRAAAITVLAALLTMACAQPVPQTQPSSSEITVTSSPVQATITLTDSGCTHSLGASLQGQFAAVIENKTSSRAAFNLHRLTDGREYRDLELHIQERQQGIAAGNDIPTLPPMTRHVAGVFVDAGQRGKLEATPSSGTYGIVCRRDSATGRTEAIYVIGPFRVT